MKQQARIRLRVARVRQAGDVMRWQRQRPKMLRLACLLSRRPPSVPFLLSSLLHRTRTGILALLLVVLPLQGVVQLVAGLQGHRHVHTGAARAASQGDAIWSGLTRPLKAVVDRLHAAQDPRLKGPGFKWLASKDPAAGLHEHGGVFHQHGADTADVLHVGDPADDAAQGGATAFLAWLPAGLALPAGGDGDRPAAIDLDWRDRVVAPLLTPPRG